MEAFLELLYKTANLSQFKFFVNKSFFVNKNLLEEKILIFPLQNKEFLQEKLLQRAPTISERAKKVGI